MISFLLIKVLIDTIFGLTLVLIITIIGFVSTLIYEQMKIFYLEIKDIILE
tara:strand:+ start:7578 stop:7730 length:153 start_codon:yes stop_codon:yes gene_type:complete